MNMNERNAAALGPSDSSDTGADLMGAANADGEQFDIPADLAESIDLPDLQANTDRSGTGERMSAGIEQVQDAADIGFDRVVDASEAGLGGGLDQAEEAQLGITDEEIARRAHRRSL